MKKNAMQRLSKLDEFYNCKNEESWQTACKTNYSFETHKKIGPVAKLEIQQIWTPSTPFRRRRFEEIILRLHLFWNKIMDIVSQLSS